MMRRYNKQKLHKSQNAGEGEDIISHLPHCILHHILSFLPTKDAVGFCMLSTQWKYLWTSLPNVNFDDLLYFGEMNGWYPLNTACFINFVERVLAVRDMSNLKKFRLSCRVFFDAFRVNKWVSTAIGSKVHELDLCLFVDEPFTLPHCVFTSESLASLTIEMNCVLELPTFISLPHLRSLHLRFITFSEDSSAQNLFSSCPILQELAILDCEWMNLTSIIISIPSLKSLIINDLPCFGSTIYVDGCEIKIHAANLESFKYSGYLSNGILLYNLSSLAIASIQDPNSCERLEISCCGAKLHSGLDKANSEKF